MAKAPKKDLNLYTLVVGPKKSTMKKGVLYTILGVTAAVVLVGSYVGVRVYVGAQDRLVEEWTEKANDTDLQEKILDANEIASDIVVMRTVSNAYDEIRIVIDGSKAYTTDTFVEQLIGCETCILDGMTTQIADITSITYDGTTLSVTANSVESRYASFFVQNLQMLGIFQEIGYSGYSSSNDGYTYTVNGELTPYEPEESTEEATP